MLWIVGTMLIRLTPKPTSARKPGRNTMNRRGVFSLSAITLLALALLPGTALPQQKSLKEQLIGTWAYVSSTARLRDGSPLWGANPKGLFILTDNGHFSWQIFRSDRPKFASNDRLHA